MNKEKPIVNLYLDDRRECPKGFVLAKNMDEAISMFSKYNINILSLDHDLGEDENKNLLPTGQDFVKYFCEKGFRANKIYIHTDNGPGREAMYQTLKAARKRGFIDSDIEIFHYSITVNKYSDY